MSEPQAAKRRVRRRNLAVQLQAALNSAQELEQAEQSDLSIARMKLVQTRIDCLLTMQARERHDKIRKLTDELKVVKAENERLRQELAAALAAKPAVRPLTEVELVLANYEASKNNGGQQ
jgi:hypothetical protein